MSILLLAAVSALQVGDTCDSNKDQFACLAKQFLACPPERQRWAIQNLCVSECSTDPGYSSFCSLNTLANATQATPSPVETMRPPLNDTAPGSIPQGINQGISTVLLVLLIVSSVLVALVLAWWIYRQKTKRDSVGHFLEKRFIVTLDYDPVAPDELALKVGQVVVLDLLFNDGWAKGRNEHTGQDGILPVACLKAIE